jgi:hypothetical protein
LGNVATIHGIDEASLTKGSLVIVRRVDEPLVVPPRLWQVPPPSVVAKDPRGAIEDKSSPRLSSHDVSRSPLPFGYFEEIAIY